MNAVHSNGTDSPNSGNHMAQNGELDELKSDASLYQKEFGLNPDDMHKCPLPGHQDTNPSFGIFTGPEGAARWKCHGCDRKGTIVDLYIELRGLDQDDACRQLIDDWGSGVSSSGPSNCDTYETNSPDWRSPSPADEPPPELKFSVKDDQKRWGHPIKHEGEWERLQYKDATIHTQACDYGDGMRAFASCRWDDVVGQSKVIRQHYYDGTSWRPSITEDNLERPLYKCEEMGESIFAIHDVVVVVEGEKCLDALQDAHRESEHRDGIPDALVTSNIGGSNAIDKADLSPLQDEDEVIVIPDNDISGLTWAHKIGVQVEHAKMIELYGDEAEDGLDIADWLQEPGNNLSKLYNLERTNPVQEGASSDEDDDDGKKDPRDYTDEEIIEMAREAKTRQDVSTTLEIIAQQEGFSPLAKSDAKEALQQDTSYNKNDLEDELEYLEQKYERDFFDKLTDRVIEDYYDGHLIHIGQNRFFHYTGTHWEEIEEGFIKRSIQRAWDEEHNPEYDPSRTQSAVFRLLGPRVQGKRERLNLRSSPPPVINTPTCELHIDPETGEVTPQEHSPDTHLTHCLDVEYDPDEDCPLFKQTLREVTCQNEEMMRHLIELMAYWIQPRRDQKEFYMLHGQTNSGKSSLISFLARDFIGQDTVVMKEIESLEQRFGKSSLIGALLFVDDDVKKNTHLPDDILKKLSEQKTISVEKKHQDEINITSSAAPILCTNHFPKTSDLTEAMRNRAHVIPFEAQFVDPQNPSHSDPDPDHHTYELDRTRYQRIREQELSGVLNLLLDGLKRLRQRGTWDMPEECMDARAEWITHSNPLAYFLSSYLEQSTGEIYANELYTLYEQWSDKTNSHKISRQNFKQRLIDQGYGDSMSGASNNKGSWKLDGYTVKA